MGRHCWIFVGLVFLVEITGCALKGQRVDRLHKVCVRYVDGEGFLRGRTALFNIRGAQRVLRAAIYTHRGECVEGAQGPPNRVIVCLVRSSKCYHDRTTNVWADQAPRYFARYKDSYYGPCDRRHAEADEAACWEHEDDCLDAARNWKGLEDWQRWMQWMREMQRERRGLQ